MAPPSYADLGKSARDLFSKGYAHGFLNWDSTTKNGDSLVEFKTAASHNIAGQKTTGRLECKYKIPQYGVTITEKWNTENTLSTAIEVKDQVSRGLTVTLDSSYVPHTAKRSALLKTEWANEVARVNADLNMSGNPVFTVAGVFAHKNALFGGQARYDVSTNEVRNTSVAMGYSTPEYTTHAFTNDGREFGASVYHKVHKNLELGAQLGWLTGDQNTRFGLASKYRAAPDILLRGKVDNKANVAVSVTHDLSPAAKLTLSAQFGLVQPINDTNKFGVALEYVPA
jgi:hypothetical protein